MVASQLSRTACGVGGRCAFSRMSPPRITSWKRVTLFFNRWTAGRHMVGSVQLLPFRKPLKTNVQPHLGRHLHLRRLRLQNGFSPPWTQRCRLAPAQLTIGRRKLHITGCSDESIWLRDGTSTIDLDSLTSLWDEEHFRHVPATRCRRCGSTRSGRCAARRAQS
jgi:hypothetical protein